VLGCKKGRQIFHVIHERQASLRDGAMGLVHDLGTYRRVKEQYNVALDSHIASMMDRYLFYEGVSCCGADGTPLELCVLEPCDVPSVENLPDLGGVCRDILSMIIDRDSLLQYYMIRVIPFHPMSRTQRPTKVARCETSICVHVIRAFLLGVYTYSASLARILFSFQNRASIFGLMWNLMAGDASKHVDFFNKYDYIVYVSFFEYLVNFSSLCCPCEFEQIFGYGPSTHRGKMAVQSCRNICNGARESWSNYIKCGDGDHLAYLNDLCSHAFEKCKRICKKDVRGGGAGVYGASLRPLVKLRSEGSAQCRVVKLQTGLSYTCRRPMLSPSIRIKNGYNLLESYYRYVHYTTYLALRVERFSLVKGLIRNVNPVLLKTMPYIHGYELSHLLSAFGSEFASVDITLMYYIQNVLHWEHLSEHECRRQYSVYMKMRSVNKFWADMCRFLYVCITCSVNARDLRNSCRLDVENVLLRVCCGCGRSDTVVRIDMIGKALLVADKRYFAIFRDTVVDMDRLRAVGNSLSSYQYVNSGNYAHDLHVNTATLCKHARDLVEYRHSMDISKQGLFTCMENIGCRLSFVSCLRDDSATRVPVSYEDALVNLTYFNLYPHLMSTSFVAPRIRVPDPKDITGTASFNAAVLARRCIGCRSKSIECVRRTFDLVLMVHRDMALCQKHSEILEKYCAPDCVDWYAVSSILYSNL
jgi:hypothetical protein